MIILFRMRPIITYIFALALISLSSIASAQSYMAYTLKNSLLKTTPSLGGVTLGKVPVSSNMFLISLYNYNGYYNVIDVNTNKEGYIAKANLKVGKEVLKSEGGLFAANGDAKGTVPDVEIFNNTSRVLTLKLNDSTYTVAPNSKNVIALAIGNCEYRASAPGVMPMIGIESVEGGHSYQWQFYMSKK
jgi:hypothetical protein